MTIYEKELQAFRPYDEMQGLRPIGRGYNKITTAGHGFLVVPKSDPFASIAHAIAQYGYNGKLAYYLEEDCEASEFISKLPA